MRVVLQAAPVDTGRGVLCAHAAAKPALEAHHLAAGWYGRGRQRRRPLLRCIRGVNRPLWARACADPVCMQPSDNRTLARALTGISNSAACGRGRKNVE